MSLSTLAWNSGANETGVKETFCAEAVCAKAKAARPAAANTRRMERSLNASPSRMPLNRAPRHSRSCHDAHSVVMIAVLVAIVMRRHRADRGAGGLNRGADNGAGDVNGGAGGGARHANSRARQA